VCDGLAKGPYMAARVGFEPTTLRTEGTKLTTDPPTPRMSIQACMYANMCIVHVCMFICACMYVDMCVCVCVCVYVCMYVCMYRSTCM